MTHHRHIQTERQTGERLTLGNILKVTVGFGKGFSKVYPTYEKVLAIFTNPNALRSQSTQSHRGYICVLRTRAHNNTKRNTNDPNGITGNFSTLQYEKIQQVEKKLKKSIITVVLICSRSCSLRVIAKNCVCRTS